MLLNNECVNNDNIILFFCTSNQNNIFNSECNLCKLNTCKCCKKGL